MYYSICKLKNISGEIKTLNGKEFSIDEIYQLQDSERISWASSSDVADAITGDLFDVYDGVGVITDHSKAIDWLKQHNPISAITEYTTAYSLKADAVMSECAVNETTEIYLKIDNKSGESYSYKYLLGGSAFGQNLEYGDWAEFDIVDKDGVYYPAGTSLKIYVCKQYVNPNGEVSVIAESPGKIPINVYLRCKYHAIDAGLTRKVFLNFLIENKD